LRLPALGRRAPLYHHPGAGGWVVVGFTRNMSFRLKGEIFTSLNAEKASG